MYIQRFVGYSCLMQGRIGLVGFCFSLKCIKLIFQELAIFLYQKIFFIKFSLSCLKSIAYNLILINCIYKSLYNLCFRFSTSQCLLPINTYDLDLVCLVYISFN